MSHTQGNGMFSSVNELLAAEVLAELPKQVEKYFMNISTSHKFLVRRNGYQPPRFVRSEEEATKLNSTQQVAMNRDPGQSHPEHAQQAQMNAQLNALTMNATHIKPY